MDYATSFLRFKYFIRFATAQLPGDFHKDPADRIIVAIAYRRNIELITCDQKFSTIHTKEIEMSGSPEILDSKN